jgi:hypothetical protein
MIEREEKGGKKSGIKGQRRTKNDEERLKT